MFSDLGTDPEFSIWPVSLSTFKEGSNSGGPRDFDRSHRRSLKSISLKGSVGSQCCLARYKRKPHQLASIEPDHAQELPGPANSGWFLSRAGREPRTSALVRP